MEEVKNGINNGREINRVTYNPNLITIEEMVNALKDANTYRGTVEDGG